eukprot:CAMPEP_0171086344 /NCGR_PEP_ID=MMETSP0766_2-20121228/19485_1 /TAXON_ID=439317 /ORGANISM="Gambierdiscus australes, Strain CAWD 149" /LENGTH=72 /DNA_ID=CAMNT_0011543983 /DNA_START=136 /DNA_END=350 /DNA_ORIENTATION=+
MATCAQDPNSALIKERTYLNETSFPRLRLRAFQPTTCSNTSGWPAAAPSRESLHIPGCTWIKLLISNAATSP